VHDAEYPAWLSLTAVVKDHAQGYPEGSYGYRRVSYIESGPVEGRHIKIQEVNNLSQPDSIDQISHGSSYDEGKTKGHPPLLLEPGKPEDQENDGGTRNRGQNNRTPSGAHVVQETEGDPSISHVNKVKETGDDDDRLINAKDVDEKKLGDLIQYDH
jgi:hypothetical protein